MTTNSPKPAIHANSLRTNPARPALAPLFGGAAAARVVGAALLCLPLAAMPAAALGISVGGLGVSVGDNGSGGLGIGVGVGGKNGVNANASVGGGSVAGAGVGVGGKNGVNANASVGGGSVADVGVGVGGKNGIKAGVGVGTGGITADVDVGPTPDDDTGGNTGGGTNGGGNGGGTLPDKPLDNVVAPSRQEWQQARSRTCHMRGNSSAFDGTTLFTSDGKPVGVIHATWLTPGLAPKQVTFVPLKSFMANSSCITLRTFKVDTGTNGLRLAVTSDTLKGIVDNFGKQG